MARTQKNKATNAHLGILKAKLAKLRRELITPKGGGGPAQEGFDVAKTGDARIGFVGRKFLTWKRRNLLSFASFLLKNMKILSPKRAKYAFSLDKIRFLVHADTRERENLQT